MTQLKRFIELFPESIKVFAGIHRYKRKIHGHNALIKAPIILVLSGDIVFGVSDISYTGICETVRRQEAAAAHARIDVAFEFQHFLLADVIRSKMLCGALCCQHCQPEVFAAFVSVVLFQKIQELRKSGCDPNADLILYALNALTEHFRDDQARSFRRPSSSPHSLRHIQTEINGACPLVVISVTT